MQRRGAPHEVWGFTLLELLLVMGLIAILASIVIVALNPGRQLAEGRNTQRRVDVNTILNAVYQYAIDNNGSLPTSITNATSEICKTGAGSCTGFIDLSGLTLNERYLTALPTDPLSTSTASSSYNGVGYYIVRTVNSRVAVTASLAENGTTITVKR